MKNKATKHDPSEDRNFPVNYQWSGSDGTICRSHTVAAGRSRADAEKQFFRDHRHIQPIEDTVDYAYD